MPRHSHELHVLTPLGVVPPELPEHDLRLRASGTCMRSPGCCVVRVTQMLSRQPANDPTYGTSFISRAPSRHSRARLMTQKQAPLDGGPKLPLITTWISSSARSLGLTCPGCLVWRATFLAPD